MLTDLSTKEKTALDEFSDGVMIAAEAAFEELIETLGDKYPYLDKELFLEQLEELISETTFDGINPDPYGEIEEIDDDNTIFGVC